MRISAATALAFSLALLCAPVSDAQEGAPPEDEALTPRAGVLPPELAGIEQIEITSTAVDESASREQADQQIDTMSADQLSAFSIPDVAAGLRFVPGVSVVDGQFAVIRGLEDRYNSTLYNSAPIPSPDPNSQSVQLDLFPSDVVSNLVISKTFAPELPSNSSGGSVNIITNGDGGDGLEIKLGAGTGFNDGAANRFVEFEGGSPIGKEADGNDVIESDFKASFRGGSQLLDRDVHYKGVFSWETDFDTKDGAYQSREPALPSTIPGFERSGGLSQGELALSGGQFDLIESERTQQGTSYLGLGGALDEDSNHTLDASVFYTQKLEEAVEFREDGYLPNFDYGTIAQRYANGDPVDASFFESSATNSAWIVDKARIDIYEPVSRGPLLTTNFNQSRSFERDRDLIVSQLNGDHWLGLVEGLHLAWAANHARTNQDEEALGARFFFEPANPAQVPTRFPVSAESLGAGRFAVNNGIFSAANDIREVQNFARIDADWETDLGRSVILELKAGMHYEKAQRDVASDYLESPTVAGQGSGSQFAILRDTPEELGKSIFDELARSGGPGSEPAGTRSSENDSEREIHAWNFGAKATFWERLDVLGGLRFEEISIESNNDAFTGEFNFDGSPKIFPTALLMFDRPDNPARGESLLPPGPNSTFNDQLLGISVSPDPVTGLVDLVDRAQIESAANGRIDERRRLPSLAFTYRPGGAVEGLTLRGAFSRTVARPSFREMGYYVSVEPGTDDLFVGNPQLGLSDVESWDTRAEYVWNDTDLLAASLFAKRIEDPIESMVIKDPTNFEGGGLYRTFFNNPSEATLEGVEIEARKNLGFIPSELASFFTLGGNVTYIDAEVDRVPVEQQRASVFFATVGGDAPRYARLDPTRRLFGQPEWIANLNLSFDQPDWGTKLTLAYFAISDVLDAAGSVAITQNGNINSYTPDRYIDGYHQLDLVLSQAWHGITFEFSAKNLTDSRRRVIYDRNQTASSIPEREFRVGRDFSFSIGYAF